MNEHVPQKGLFISWQTALAIALGVPLLIAGIGCLYLYRENQRLLTENSVLQDEKSNLMDAKLAAESDVEKLKIQVTELGGKVEDLNTTNDNLNNKVGTLNTQVKDLNGKLELSDAAVVFFSDLSLTVADLFGRLDANILETDTNSVEFINWVYENAYFYDTDTANYMYNEWYATQEKTNQDYWAIKGDVDYIVGQIEQYLN